MLTWVLEWPSPCLLDIDQLKRIMEVVGTPTPELLKKISSEHVRKETLLICILLLQKTVMFNSIRLTVWINFPKTPLEGMSSSKSLQKFTFIPNLISLGF